MEMFKFSSAIIKYIRIIIHLYGLDMIAAPDFNSMGMENWGIIMYRETALLYKPGVSSASDKQTITHVVAHELAHMVKTITMFKFISLHLTNLVY